MNQVPVVFAPSATEDIREMATWLGSQSSAARTNFLAALADKVRLIEQQPEMYPVALLQASLRRCVVLPTVVLYYGIKPEVIEIVGVVDARRDPNALRLPPA